MPDDGVTQIPGDESSANVVNDIPLFAVLSQIVQLVQSGNVAQNNFITKCKAMDYEFLELRRTMDVSRAIGVREIASQ
jgi:hypothetical protein